MSQQKPASPFGCCFCREPLEPIPFCVTDFLWALMLVRPYRCPHCFQCYFRPFSVLLAIPIFGGMLGAILDRLGFLPTLKVKQTRQYQSPQDSTVEIACSK